MMRQNPCRSTSDIKRLLLGGRKKGTLTAPHTTTILKVASTRLQCHWTKISRKQIMFIENHGIRFRSSSNFIKFHQDEQGQDFSPLRLCLWTWMVKVQLVNPVRCDQGKPILWIQKSPGCPFPYKSNKSPCDPCEVLVQGPISVGIFSCCVLMVFVVSWCFCRPFWANPKGPCRKPYLRGLANTYSDDAHAKPCNTRYSELPKARNFARDRLCDP